MLVEYNELGKERIKNWFVLVPSFFGVPLEKTQGCRRGFITAYWLTGEMLEEGAGGRFIEQGEKYLRGE